MYIIFTHVFIYFYLVISYYFTIQVEYFHRLWNFDNCQFAVMEFQSEGYYELISELKVDP